MMYECPDCKEQIKDVDNLKTHIQIFHDPNKYYVADAVMIAKKKGIIKTIKQLIRGTKTMVQEIEKPKINPIKIVEPTPEVVAEIQEPKPLSNEDIKKVQDDLHNFRKVTNKTKIDDQEIPTPEELFDQKIGNIIIEEDNKLVLNNIEPKNKQLLRVLKMMHDKNIINLKLDFDIDNGITATIRRTK